MPRILVIEDNTDVRENLCEILELSGYDVISTFNGKKGVEMAISESPDLIICDVMMPELDGFGVLKILSQHKSAFRVPFIFLTAKTEKRDIRRGMGLGASDFITKPFDDIELLEAVETRLQLSERSQSGFTGDYEFQIQKSLANINSLFETGEIRTFSSGQALFEQGRNPHFVYLVRGGMIKLQSTNHLGKTIIISVVGPGEIIGFENAWIRGPYTFESVAMKRTEVSQLSKDRLLDAVRENTIHYDFFLRQLIKKKQDHESRLNELAFGSLREKIAGALLRFGDKVHDNLKSGDAIQISREDLANMAGSAVESTIRTLSDFKSDNIIVVEKDEIRILDVVKLREIAASNF
ncbi:MAG: response regulator [Bacteroidia bacterium]|nr:response regulator [Bacteroidia bacterium]